MIGQLDSLTHLLYTCEQISRFSYRNPGIEGYTMKKLTPVFVVDRIEPCLDFWVGRLGFEKTVEVPEGDSIGFVILSRGNVEIMYQSRESLEKDLPALAEIPRGSGFSVGTYIEVSNIDDVITAARRLGPGCPEANDLLWSNRVRRARAGRKCRSFSRNRLKAKKKVRDDIFENRPDPVIV